jgi:hypothetical protein
MVKPVFDIYERLDPPRRLSAEQREVWASIVGGQPGDWFASGSIPLLTQLCRHVVMSNRLAELIESTQDKATILDLVKQQRDESDAIRKLSTSLRITPQSLVQQRGNKKITAIQQPHARIAG